MRNNKLSQFTIDELNRINQDGYFDELWFLRHSPAARRLFAEMQTSVYVMSLFDRHDDAWRREVTELRALASGLEELCCECISHHPWWHCTFNPNRVIVPSKFSWVRLAELFGVTTKPNKWQDETLYKTILGWQQL